MSAGILAYGYKAFCPIEPSPHIEHADDIVYVSTWKHVHPPLALPGDLREERAFYDSDRAPFDFRRQMEYWQAWHLIVDDSSDNWAIDRVKFQLMDPALKQYGIPPVKEPYKIPFFSIPVPASCQIMLENCSDTFLGHGPQEDGEVISFHYFHPDVEEALMYPKVPVPATGRTSLEWYQIIAMRYRNPALIPCSESVDIWMYLATQKKNSWTRTTTRLSFRLLRTTFIPKDPENVIATW